MKKNFGITICVYLTFLCSFAPLESSALVIDRTLSWDWNDPGVGLDGWTNSRMNVGGTEEQLSEGNNGYLRLNSGFGFGIVHRNMTSEYYSPYSNFYLDSASFNLRVHSGNSLYSAWPQLYANGQGIASGNGFSKQAVGNGWINYSTALSNSAEIRGNSYPLIHGYYSSQNGPIYSDIDEIRFTGHEVIAPESLTTAKINLENGGSYISPVLSSQNSLESFYIQDSDGNNIDPNSLSVDKVTKLISASNTLSDMVNFDLKGFENELATEKSDALGRMVAANGLNISEKVVANGSTYLAGVGAAALACSAGAPGAGTVICGGGAAVYGLAGTLVSIATDVLDSGDQLLLDKYYYTIGKDLVDYSTSKPNGEKSYLELVNETLGQVVGQATGADGLDYETLQYASIHYNQHVRATLLGQQFLSMAGEDPDTTQTIIDNSLDPFLLGIPGAISFLENEGDRDVAKTRAELLLADAYNNYLGDLSPRSLEWNKLRAICSGVVAGDCPDNDLGDIASGSKTIEQYFQENITIEPTDFGDGTFVGWVPSGPGTAEIVSIQDNYLLSLTTGSPVSVTKVIDTPDSSFQLFFDYMFQTDTGFLDILLNDILLTTIEAPDVLSDDFTRMFLTITDSDLFGLTSVDLVFNFDGPTGSNILIDNIYASSPSYIAQAAPVPEPASLILFLSGLFGLGSARRFRKTSIRRA